MNPRILASKFNNWRCRPSIFWSWSRRGFNTTRDQVGEWRSHDGCDYEHWLVVMDPPQAYPPRHQIVQTYLETLAPVLGSIDEAKSAIYSVSTKYYYAFGCKVSQELSFKIRTQPNVRWVLPDSYIHLDNNYGGEPFIDGKVVPYDAKFHADWLQCQNDSYSIETKTGRHRRRRR